MRTILHLLLLVALLHYGQCCLKKVKPGTRANPAAQPSLSDILGPNVNTQPYTSSGDNPQGSCDGLSCNFESSCCWSNALPPADQLNWAQASGQPDAAKMQKNFATTTVPEGSYLVTASSVKGDAAQTAQFYSCPISCSNNDVTVKVKHWSTTGVKVQVCTETDPAGPPQNCQDLPAANGNQDTVTVPKAENQRIVIQATGFTAAGSAAIISNLEVTCDACPAETTASTGGPVTEVTPGPSTAPSTVCQDVPCNFEDGSLCKYQAGGTANQNFAVQKTPFNNRLTGVPKPGEGSAFAGGYVKAKQGEKTTLTTKTNLDKDYTIKAKYHEDTEGVTLKGCCNDESTCPFDSKDQVEVKDYQAWRTAYFTCSAGTSQILFVGENTKGANEGAVAIDDIQVMEAATPPESASTSACGGAPAAPPASPPPARARSRAAMMAHH